MATLNSPGVDISVIDESGYATAGEGTVPLIILGTHEYKIQPNGVDIAEGTLPENANKLYIITSQRELVQTFGNPVFYQRNGTSRHGYELNEYGLHATYQYLGMANRAYVIRGSVDYAQLFPSDSEPRGEPLAGTYWFDTANTKFGIFSGVASTYPNSAWTPQTPAVLTSLADHQARVIASNEYPNASAPVTTTPGNLVINGTTIAIATTDTLASLVTAIQTSVTGVTANILQLSGMSRLILLANAGYEFDFTGSTPAILSSIGLNGNEIVETVPRTTIGISGSFAVSITNGNTMYQKIVPGGVATINDPLAIATWLEIGSDIWTKATPTRSIGGNLGSTTVPALNGQTLTINVSNDPSTEVSIVFGNDLTPADVVSFINSELGAANNATSNAIEAFLDAGSVVLVNKLGGDIVLDSDSVAATVIGITTKFGKLLRFAPNYQVPRRTDDLGRQVVAAGEVWINTTEYNNGSKWSVKLYNAVSGAWITIPAPLLATDVAADVLFGGSKTIGTLYVRYNKTGAVPPIANFAIRRWSGSVWEDLVYAYGAVAPSTSPVEGTMWFNDDFRVDIMVADGDQWVGYRNRPENFNTNATGVLLAGSAPTTQTNGNPLVQNDLWIDTSDTENYPKLYRYQEATRSWSLIDNSDSVTPFGIVFEDARAASAGTKDASTAIEDMLVSDYLDPDAPDPRLYPDGVLLFNTRYSTNNVKEWRPNYFAGEFDPNTNFTISGYNVGYSSFGPVASAGRWVTISGNTNDGSPNMGRKAQRAVIVRALGATISSNEDIRAESIYYNLMATPGYVELIDEMVTLNTDRKETAFIIGDTPARLKPNSTAIQTWANVELSGAASNSETGITTNSPYVGVYYPWGYSTNVDGFEVVVPPSTMALRTYAYNDSIAYPWFAPAGYQRGLVTNATNVGYITEEGEFKAVFLNEGQRDTLYLNKINPIAFLPNRGLALFGQKTRSATATAMDRVNVARLINKMRYDLDALAKPFLFEPNDKHTRDAFKISTDRYMTNLVALRALYDFLTICDESNNTPDRVNRNELWLDAIISPTKAVEFIYIPLRIAPYGTDLNTLFNIDNGNATQVSNS